MRKKFNLRFGNSIKNAIYATIFSLGVSALAGDLKESLPTPSLISSKLITREKTKKMFQKQINYLETKKINRPLFYLEEFADDYSVWFKIGKDYSILYTDNYNNDYLDEIRLFDKSYCNAVIKLDGEIKKRLELILKNDVYSNGILIKEVDGQMITFSLEDYCPPKEKLKELGDEIYKFLIQYKHN
jgi:hypothetical protein